MSRFFGTKSKSTLTDSTIKIPDINNMPESERPIFKEDLAASTTGQKIFFGFRVVDLLDPQGEEILKSFAKAVSFLPEYAIQIEGHSNLAKSEEKLTAADKARTQKLSEDRADACARFLKAANVQNEITCKAMGPLKGETKGCVRLVLSQKTIPLEAAQGTLEGETKPSQKDGAAVETLTPDTATVEEASIAPLKGTDAEFTIEVLPEKSSSEEGQKPVDVEETDVPKASESSAGKSSAGKEHFTDPTDIDASALSKENEGPSVIDASDENAIPESSANTQSGQWGLSRYLPWGIVCCSPKTQPQTKECSVQVLPVKQKQIFS